MSGLSQVIEIEIEIDESYQECECGFILGGWGRGVEIGRREGERDRAGGGGVEDCGECGEEGGRDGGGG